EQLDGAGIELPNFYKWIENAEKYLQTHRTVKRITKSFDDELPIGYKNTGDEKHRGKRLEDDASGFLRKRVAPEEVKATNHDVDWSSFNELCFTWTTNTLFRSKNKASTWPECRNKLQKLDSPFLVQMK
nr:hypothetical protein [Tanacetum cinerariifolium]